MHSCCSHQATCRDSVRSLSIPTSSEMRATSATTAASAPVLFRCGSHTTPPFRPNCAASEAGLSDAARMMSAATFAEKKSSYCTTAGAWSCSTVRDRKSSAAKPPASEARGSPAGALQSVAEDGFAGDRSCPPMSRAGSSRGAATHMDWSLFHAHWDESARQLAPEPCQHQSSSAATARIFARSVKDRAIHIEVGSTPVLVHGTALHRSMRAFVDHWQGIRQAGIGAVVRVLRSRRSSEFAGLTARVRQSSQR